MKKLDNFSNCLMVLSQADFNFAFQNEIYRTGVIGQFNLTFELAWKALKEVMLCHGADCQTGSPREILKLGYQLGFLEQQETWLLILEKHNLSVHIYDEEAADTLLLLIRDSFLPAFVVLKETLTEKLNEIQ